jgi:hypothetical protein
MNLIFFQLNLISNQLKGTKKRLKRDMKTITWLLNLYIYFDFVKSNFFLWQLFTTWQQKDVLQMTLRILNYMILKNHHNMMTQMGEITILLTISIMHCSHWQIPLLDATNMTCNKSSLPFRSPKCGSHH